MRPGLIALFLVLLLPLPAGAAEPVLAEPCFTLTPGADCGARIVAEIARARHTLLVQAYNFTEPAIVQAIIDAHRRGVAVTVMLDKISPSQRCAGADAVRAAGIPVWIDHIPKIAHNKVMVIDGQAVITGSFNFSIAAETDNAENLVVLRSTDLAAAYRENFDRRLAVSVQYDGTHRRPVPVCLRDLDAE